MRNVKLIALGWLVLGGATANGHEFWLEPSSWQVDRLAPVAVRLCVGDNYQAQPLARDSDRIEEFFAVHADARREVVGRDGSNPAGFVHIEGAGTHVLGYRSNRAFAAQPDEKFVAYLHEDGLEAIIPQRAQPDQPERPVRESYSRYAKALVRAGDGALVDRPVGFELELVAESDDTFRTLYQGQPLAGALLKAMRLGGRDAEMSVRTDATGRGRFELREPGAWRISVVHMTRPPAGVDAEWDSLWASLTFASGAALADAAPHCTNRVP